MDKTKVLKTWEGTDICRVLRTASCALGTSKLQLWVANLIAECQRRVCCGNMSKGSGRLARSVLCSIEFDFCKISACRFSLSRMFPCSALKNLGLSHKGGTVWDQNVPQFASNSIFERERPNSIFDVPLRPGFLLGKFDIFERERDDWRLRDDSRPCFSVGRFLLINAWNVLLWMTFPHPSKIF